MSNPDLPENASRYVGEFLDRHRLRDDFVLSYETVTICWIAHAIQSLHAAHAGVASDRLDAIPASGLILRLIEYAGDYAEQAVVAFLTGSMYPSRVLSRKVQELGQAVKFMLRGKPPESRFAAFLEDYLQREGIRVTSYERVASPNSSFGARWVSEDIERSRGELERMSAFVSVMCANFQAAAHMEFPGAIWPDPHAGAARLDTNDAALSSYLTHMLINVPSDGAALLQDIQCSSNPETENALHLRGSMAAHLLLLLGVHTLLEACELFAQHYEHREEVGALARGVAILKTRVGQVYHNYRG